MLSTNQEGIKESMLSFILDKKDPKRFMRVSACAGSGKSRIISEVYKDYNEISDTSLKLGQVRPNSLYITATTNPAVHELSALGVPNPVTIFSLLGLSVKENWETGKTELVFGRRKIKFDVDSTVIVDESSFISEELFQYMLNSDLRFILVGDDQQFLCPGNDTEDTVDTASLSSFIDNEETFRFEEKLFADYVIHLRRLVKDRVIEAIPEILGDTLETLGDTAFINQLVDSFKYSPEDCKLISFTNDIANEYDRNINSVVGNTDEVIDGSKLVFKGNVRNSMGYSLNLQGGNSYTEVYSTDSRNEALDSAGISYQSVTNRKRSCTTYLIQDQYKFKQLSNSLAKNKLWSKYFELKNTVSTINRGYSSTAHSSQGSSIHTVFLDLTDITKIVHTCSRDTIARLIYVAISRAKSKVYIRGSIPNWILGSY